MTQSLLIFDVDGTLITTRAGRRAFNRAFEKVFGLTDAAGTVAMAGRTDPLIFREICEAHGLDPRAFGAWKLEFLASLAEQLTQDSGYVHAGVMDLLEECQRAPDLALALGTGNVEEGARLKLAPHNLNRFFPTGGFGEDGETRGEVIRRAMERSEGAYGCRFERVLVIGDTPHDIQCGQENGCIAVGVATGHFSVADLRACGADVVLPDFANVTGVLQKIRGYT